MPTKRQIKALLVGCLSLFLITSLILYYQPTKQSTKIVSHEYKTSFQSTPWAKTYGTEYEDWASMIIQTSDGGYLIVGKTQQIDHVYWDIWLIKINRFGEIEWEKAYGTINHDDEALSVQQTSDGGYIVAGLTESFNVNASDAWILKLNRSGDIEWEKAYGYDDYDKADAIMQTSDGGYIVLATLGELGGDFWLFKLNRSGDIEWQKQYVANDWEHAYSIQETSDGGYIIVGDTHSFGAGGFDIWAIKVNQTGSIEWQKTYGDSGDDTAYVVMATSDGGFIILGTTTSFGAVYEDVWVLKLNETGDVEWQKKFGGDDRDIGYSIVETDDNGYIIAGKTYSFTPADWDIWLVKLNHTGSIEWQKVYGGTGTDRASSILQLPSGDYLVLGTTSSFGAGFGDIWTLEINESGYICFIDDVNVWVRDTNAQSNDTNVVPSTTNVLPKSPIITVTNTSSDVWDTHAIVKVQAPNTTALKANILAPQNGSYVKGIVNINVSCESKYFNSGAILIDSIQFSKWNESGVKTFAWNTTTYQDGVHNITLISYDFFGNEFSVFVLVTVDNTPPTVTIISPKNGSTLNTANFVVSWNVTDNFGIRNVYLRIDNGSWINVTNLTEFSISDIPDGEHRIYIQAVDNAGNQVIVLLVITIEKSPVFQTTITYLAVGAAVAGAAVILIKRLKSK